MLAPIESFSNIKIFQNPTFEGKLGYFRTTYNNKITNIKFTQDSISFIKKRGTIKGLHFQKDKFAQAKLVSVLQGEIIDVFVDIDPQSKNFLNHGSIKLSSENMQSIFIPKGFAHGYMTLSNKTLISYKIAGKYMPEHECTIKWDDEDIAIKWPNFKNIYLSEKDKNGSNIRDIFQDNV
jgi:dTDP-4-dehydrorhamnose 3,5-epimerase